VQGKGPVRQQWINSSHTNSNSVPLTVLLVCFHRLSKQTHWANLVSRRSCLGGLLDGKTGRGGRGGLPGLSPSVGVSTVTLRPPDVPLPVEVFLLCVRSDILEEQECSVLQPGGQDIYITDLGANTNKQTNSGEERWGT
jgi:hypothetical protein